MQSSVFAQRLDIDAKSDFSAELSKLVVRSTGCDQLEPSPDGTCDSLATGFSGSFEKLFRDFYSDFSCFRHGQTIVIYLPAEIPVLYVVIVDEVLTRTLFEAQARSSCTNLLETMNRVDLLLRLVMFRYRHDPRTGDNTEMNASHPISHIAFVPRRPLR